MFDVNNISKIDGNNGKYTDKTVSNPSERYGRNAVNNYFSYLEKPLAEDKMTPAPILDFSLNPNAAENNAEKLEQFTKENDDYLKALPPLEFEYRYMPNIENGKIDRQALLGAAYEEMGKHDSVSVNEMNKYLAPDDSFTFEPLDVNKDGQIDKSEYATSILAADMLSKSETPDTKNIDGTINSKGLNALLAYTKKSNAAAATALYSNIYNKFNLGNQ